jgi:hypothetical protein
MRRMKIIFLCSVLQTAVATCWSVPVPVLQPSERCLVVASTRDKAKTVDKVKAVQLDLKEGISDRSDIKYL